MFERIIGPFRGVFIATYACPMGQLGDKFLGYYKVFDRRPASFFETDHVKVAATAELFTSPELALHRAVLRARQELVADASCVGTSSGSGVLRSPEI